jgi:EpsI family protein
MNIMRRALLVASGSAAAAGIAYAATPRKKLADTLPKVDLEAMFPKQFGEWQIDRFTPVVQPSPDVQAKLNELYNQTLARTYLRANGERMMLSVAYGGDQSDGLQLHLPEVCYPAQGFDISALRNDSVDMQAGAIAVRRMRAQLTRRIEQVSYWTIVGQSITTWGSNRKLTQMRYSLNGVIPDGFLVRVSNLDARAESAVALQNSFTADLVAGMDSANRLRLTGLAYFLEDRRGSRIA